jgi:diacylglycerol O-acyltransferase / wax synthase
MPAALPDPGRREQGVIPMERLTATDQLMLWPDALWPQDIGAVAVLDGACLIDPTGRLRVEAVRGAVASRLHLVPRFRQLLCVPPRRLGGPLWVDAPAFDVADHVSVLALAPPADDARLLDAVERLRRRRLDRSRPLWEMWFLTGLQDGHVGLFVRMHHAMADGMAAVATASAFLDPTPDYEPVPPRPWSPAPAPTPDELRADKRRRQLRQVRQALASPAHPVRAVRPVWSAGSSMWELLAARPLPTTSLNCVVGPGRSLALIRSRLDLVKKVAHAHDATVNDVLVAMIGGGLRALLTTRGEPVDGVVLRIYVPVSLHREPRTQARGNSIGQLVVPVPIGVADPGARLRLIAQDTARHKKRSRPSLGKLPRRGIAGRAFLTLLARQHVNVTSADIPGPEVPLHLAGARLLEVFPLVPLIATVSLAVGAMSYAGQLEIMVVADRDAHPDLDVFAESVQDELRDLAVAAGIPSLSP